MSRTFCRCCQLALVVSPIYSRISKGPLICLHNMRLSSAGMSRTFCRCCQLALVVSPIYSRISKGPLICLHNMRLSSAGMSRTFCRCCQLALVVSPIYSRISKGPLICLHNMRLNGEKTCKFAYNFTVSKHSKWYENIQSSLTGTSFLQHILRGSMVPFH